MIHEITLEQMALNLESAVTDVQQHHHQLVVVHHGRRVMAMIPIEFYERWFAERAKAFRYFDELPTRGSPYSDDEVHADVEQAITQVRALEPGS